MLRLSIFTTDEGDSISQTEHVPSFFSQIVFIFNHNCEVYALNTFYIHTKILYIMINHFGSH